MNIKRMMPSTNYEIRFIMNKYNTMPTLHLHVRENGGRRRFFVFFRLALGEYLQVCNITKEAN